LFSFSKDYNSENMFGFTSCFLLSRNKNTENAFSKENVFLDFLKITLFVIAFLFYPKWDFWFQLKTRFYCFQFLVRLRKYFHWKCLQKSNQTHFHHHFLFPMRMKTENNQIKQPLKFLSIFKLLLDFKLHVDSYLVKWTSSTNLHYRKMIRTHYPAWYHHHDVLENWLMGLILGVWTHQSWWWWADVWVIKSVTWLSRSNKCYLSHWDLYNSIPYPIDLQNGLCFQPQRTTKIQF